MDQAEKLRLLVKKEQESRYSKKSFFFCSLTGGSGCTTVVLNVADILAKEFKIIIVELNFLTPSICNYLNLINNFNFEDIYIKNNFENYIQNYRKNFDVFCANYLSDYENYGEIKNNIIKLDNFFGVNYNIVLYDVGSQIFFFDYRIFFEKIFFVLEPKKNCYNNFFRLLQKVNYLDKKTEIIINKVKDNAQTKSKFSILREKSDKINNIFLIDYFKKVDMLSEYKDYIQETKSISQSSSVIANNIKLRLI